TTVKAFGNNTVDLHINGNLCDLWLKNIYCNPGATFTSSVGVQLGTSCVFCLDSKITDSQCSGGGTSYGTADFRISGTNKPVTLQTWNWSLLNSDASKRYVGMNGMAGFNSFVSFENTRRPIEANYPTNWRHYRSSWIERDALNTWTSPSGSPVARC